MFLPRVPTDTFMQLLAHAADVVLDTFPVGGCTTSLQAFFVGRPVLSLPSSHLRGRFTLGMLRRMGLEEPLAVTSADEYVAAAVKLGIDAGYRRTIEALVAERSSRLFDDRAPALAFAKMLGEMVAQARAAAAAPKGGDEESVRDAARMEQRCVLMEAKTVDLEVARPLLAGFQFRVLQERMRSAEKGTGQAPSLLAGRVHARCLLTPKRLDIAAKIPLARSWLMPGSNGAASWAMELYAEHLRFMNGFEERSTFLDAQTGEKILEVTKNSLIDIVGPFKSLVKGAS